jgi:hypothetical protein
MNVEFYDDVKPATPRIEERNENWAKMKKQDEEE